MSPELVKYALIGLFAFLIGAVIYEWSKTGFKLTKPDPDKPLFRKATKEERRRKLKTDLMIGAALVVVVIVLDRCARG